MTTRDGCLVCNCQGTMTLDADALGVERIHTELCRAQLDAFESALDGGAPLVACVQEAPLFGEVAAEKGREARFVNIRETGGWSAEGPAAMPKIAALLDAADAIETPARLQSVASDGHCVIWGAGQAALDMAEALSRQLSVTLVFSDDEAVLLPPRIDFAVYRGVAPRAAGSLGRFRIAFDALAPMRPSSRGEPVFGAAKAGTEIGCSLILDLSGHAPLVSGHRHRDGYERADPKDPAGAWRAALKLTALSGEFEKPIYIALDPSICAHSRSAQSGCNKCLDTCPAGAITSAGDTVAIDAGICAGCGGCHSVCPTGAISYQYPKRVDLVARGRRLLSGYADHGGTHPVLLVHDGAGMALVNAMAREGRGLPARVLPLELHAATTPGHVEMLTWIAGGASRVVMLADPARADELNGLEAQAALANTILSQMGYSARVEIVCEPDPDAVEDRLWSLPLEDAPMRTGFLATGSKREVGRLALGALNAEAPSPITIAPMPAGSPYGEVAIDRDACTLCMACTTVCPTGAMADTPDEPRLRFTESACVQCSLCVSTCPEDALTLAPRLNLTPAAMQPITLNEEEPFECVSCGKPFATRSAIERVREKLKGHAMFAGDKAALFELCETCRVEAMANSADDPFTAGNRPRVRTTADYEAGRLTADDFLID